MITWLVVSGQTGGRGPRRAKPRSNCKTADHQGQVRQEPHPPALHVATETQRRFMTAATSVPHDNNSGRKLDLRNHRSCLDKREGEAPAETNHAQIAKQPITKTRFGRSLTLPALHAAIETQHRFMPAATSAPQGNNSGRKLDLRNHRSCLDKREGEAPAEPNHAQIAKQPITKTRFGRSLTLPALHAAIETQHRFMPAATSAPHDNNSGRKLDLRNHRSCLDKREGEAPAEPNHTPIAKQPITKARFGGSLTLPALHAAKETQRRFMPVATSAPLGNNRRGKRTYEITGRG